ncbi:MAG: ABC transporter permease [Planctomycetota bacterium]|nr:ABC transporter permease [Planctomycetota bacterium]
MANNLLFGDLINWAWTTPVWLISVGITIGILICGLIVLLGLGLSRVPTLNQINENPKQRLLLAAGLTVLTNLILYPVFWGPALVDWMGNSHHLGAFQPFSDLKIAAENPPGFSAVILAVILMFTTIFVAWQTLFALCSRKLMSEVGILVTEGPMGWLLWIGIYFVFVAVMGIVLAKTNGLGTNLYIAEKPTEILKPLNRLTATGVSQVKKFEIPADVEQGHEIDISFNGSELSGMEIWSDQNIEIQDSVFKDQTREDRINELARIKIAPDQPARAMRQGISERTIGFGEISSLFVKNSSEEPANLEIRVITQPTVPQLQVVRTASLIVVGIFLFFVFLRGVAPKVSAVALSTFKTEVSQPVYMILMVIAIVCVGLFVILPYNTFGEDIKMLKDAGLTLILVLSIFLAIWAASKSIAEEIEGRTALTVLSKPIGRRQFIIGKFVGIGWSLAIFAIVVGIVVFVPAVSYKATYDAKEAALDAIKWQECYSETVKIIPGIALGFMETLVFIAISVTISTRLPIMANILICFSIYVLGHLTPLIVQSTVAVDAFETVVFFGQLVATIFPVLDHFNIQAAISGDAVVPMSYLGWSLVYCTIYGAIALLLGLIFFEDRDVA